MLYHDKRKLWEAHRRSGNFLWRDCPARKPPHNFSGGNMWLGMRHRWTCHTAHISSADCPDW